jgi:hypothetical protein
VISGIVHMLRADVLARLPVYGLTPIDNWTDIFLCPEGSTIGLSQFQGPPFRRCKGGRSKTPSAARVAGKQPKSAR